MNRYRERTLLFGACVIAVVLAVLPPLALLRTNAREVSGALLAGEVALSVVLVMIFGVVLRQVDPGFAKGLAWGIVAVLAFSIVLWSIAHLPAH